MMFFGFLLIALVLYFVFRGEIHLTSDSKSDAKDVLKQRLAKGEITIEEYNELKQALNHHNG